MFRTDLLSIIRSLNTVYTAIGICHASYVDCLLGTLLTDSQHNLHDKYLLLCIQYWDSWWWIVDLSETYRVLHQNKFEKYYISLAFIVRSHRVYLHKPWNLALTWPPYGCKSFQVSIPRIGRYHPNWRFPLASNFSPQSAYLDFPKILATVIYVFRRNPKRYVAHDCIIFVFWMY